MDYVIVLVAGGIFFVIFSWAAEVFVSRRQDELRLSSDERVANERAERLLVDFCEHGLEPMNRRQILERAGWVWKSSRLVALRSGSWAAVPWLATMAAACLLVVGKTAVWPNSHDLRVLLGVRDFICFLVLPPQR